jgi:hypothetical protein
MNAVVSELVEKALLLPAEARAELLEAIWERETPSQAFISNQMSIVAGRMENVRNGTSTLIPAADAHRMVLESLRENA